ncbi:hypothetical protein QL285_054394 [Trifolium repens]|nr:hypothetical protein QL285_054394 [Trifolium repens]
MSPLEYRDIPKYCLMILLFPKDDVCPICRKACFDTFGEHAAHCREFPDFKYRHDLVIDVLFNIFRRAEISVKKEAPVNFLTDPQEERSTLHHADVLVYGWVGEKHVLCRFDWNFLTCATGGWRFYGGTSSPQSYFKQNGQI